MSILCIHRGKYKQNKLHKVFLKQLLREIDIHAVSHPVALCDNEHSAFAPQVFCWVCATAAWVITTAWPVVTGGHTQMWKTSVSWSSWNMGYAIFPWSDELLHACFPSCKFYRSPFIDHLLWIPKSLAHSSTCKCLNVQGQVAVLCKTESIWISRNPRWREERRNKRTKSHIWFNSSRFVSGMLSGSPFLPPYSTASRDTIWGLRELSKHPHYSKKKTTSANRQARMSFYTRHQRAWHSHIWKQLLHSQGVTDESWAQRRGFCSFYCFSGIKGYNLIFVQLCL